MYKKTSLILLLAVLILGPPITAADPADDYAIRWTKSTPLDDLPAAHLAANPAQGFDAWIAPGGIQIKPHVGDWNLRLELLRVGREGAMHRVESAGVETKGARAELHRGGDRQPGSLVEWYVNDEKGLEQGFTIATAPLIPSKGTPDSTLVLELALEGDLVPLLAADGRRVNLLFPDGPLPVLVYGSLAVVDAEGREVPARMELGKGTLRIAVEDSGVAYPLTVDPLLSSAAWTSAYPDISYSAAWGDWDGDGDLDLAIGSNGPNRVYENQDGNLVAAWTSADSEATYSLEWGDWDGDGDLDLAAGNNGPNRIYDNDGNTLTSTWISLEADWTYSLVWGDWDGDGDLDLAAGNWGTNNVYENNSGALTAVWTSDESAWTIGVAWGDWDGDGDLDLAAGNHDQKNHIYENNGGGFDLAWTASVSEPSLGVAWGDWDGDGDLDLAVGNSGPNRVYQNNDGSFVSAWVSSEPPALSVSVAWGDWDGDGDLDLAASNVGPNRVYQNTGGDLAFTWASTDDLYTWTVAWGDWDGDGDLDLATANENQANVYENTGHPLTSAWTSVEIEDTASIAWGDWDGDGDPDLAVGNASAQPNRIYENIDGDLTVAWNSIETDETVNIAWGDWDGDGDLDLAVGNDGPNRVYENTGDDFALAWTSNQTDYTFGIAWGDWDGDGDLDLAAGNLMFPTESGGQNRVYENTGGDLALAWSSTERDRTYGIAWGDWDSDGDLDLAVGNDGPNRVYENTGGDLSPAWATPTTPSEWTVAVAWGDWDGDGDLDLAAANYMSESNHVYENTGGDLTVAWTSTENENTASVAWGDWDGDGDLDLAAANFIDEPNRIYENTGGNLILASSYPNTVFTRCLAWADWDDDGDLDLTTGNLGSAIRILENGVLSRPGGLPETSVSPVLSQRPGTTDAAFFYSTPELLRSPIVVNYTLVDEESDPARRIVLEFSLTGGGSWLPATEQWSDGTEELATSPEGTPHIFYWDATADGVFQADNVVFRITVPYQASTRLAGPIQRAAMSAVSPPFRIGSGPLADLSVTKSDGREIVTAGEDVTYVIQVTNQGPEDVLGAWLMDTFPTEITDISWTCDDAGGGTCFKGSGSGHLDERVDLPTGTSVTFSATGTVDPLAAGKISNTATVTLPVGMTEIDPSDNVAIDEDRVEPPETGIKTLILVHPDRMGLTDAEGAQMIDDLLRLASHSQVHGKVVDLGEDPGLQLLFNVWDADPGDPVKANSVLFGSGGVHDIVLGLLETHTHVDYLILVGGDEVIPMARFEDQTHPAYRESVYTEGDATTNELWGISPDGSTVGRALAANRYLSDDPLAARKPVTVGDLDGEIGSYLTRLEVGRLLESVDDVSRVVDAFISQDGAIDLTALDPLTGHKVLVSGYQFLLDAGKEARKRWQDALGIGDPVPGYDCHTAPVNDCLVGDYWTKDELLDSLCGVGGSSYKISNLNGHATHWEIGFPGAGSAGRYGLPTSELVDTSVCGPPDVAGNLFYTADCHGGLSVPQTEPEGKTLDLPQAFASLGVSAYLANSGFGWGLRCGLGYSELLVQMFTEELIDRGITTVGEAVNEAKSRYYTETLLLDNYDLKTLRQWRLTGIPNLELRVGPPASAPARWVDDGTGVERLGPVTVTRQVSGGAATAGRETDPSLPDHMTVLKLDFNLSADDVYTKYRTSGEEITGSCLPFPAAGQEPADRVQCQGCYYTWNGHHSTGEADLPVQPYVAYESNLDDLIRQGVLWKGARYEVEEDWAPTFGWLSSEGELPPNPVSLPRRVYIKPRGRYAPATKAATCVPAGENTGPIVFTTAEVEDDPDVLADYSILKLHRHVDLEVFYLPESGAGNPSCDQAGPIFGPALDGGDDYHDLEDDLLHWKVPMFDTSGVLRVLLVYDDYTVNAQGYGSWKPLELVEESPGVWSASLQLTDTSHVSYYLQAVDELGNVSWLLENLDLPPSGIPFELPKLVDVTVPSVSVPWVDGAEGMTFDITVKIEPRQEMVAALAFSLDYDETCLDPDLDDYTFTVPQGFTTELEFDPPGASGEIAASIYDASPPIGALPAGDLLRLSFKVICSAPLATVSFSSVTFGDDLGQNLPGSGVSGGVRILSGLRGDCNGNGKVEVPDFTALGLEIDDGGGVFWADAIGGTFPGSPIGCDANANTEINAADLTCISEIISGRACAVARANRVALPTLASVTATAAASPGDLSWIGVRVEPNAEIGAMVLALDLDPAVFDLAALDGDGDGYADRVDYANGEPGFAMVRAHDGKLVVVLADRSRTPFPKGMLLEVGVPVLSPANPTVGLSISDAPPTSFGTVDGADMPGQAVIDNGAIFIDDFESGSTSNWSATVP